MNGNLNEMEFDFEEREPRIRLFKCGEDINIRDNAVMADRRLGYAEKGLFVEIMSRENKSEFTISDLAKRSKLSVRSIKMLINRLKKYCYIEIMDNQSEYMKECYPDSERGTAELRCVLINREDKTRELCGGLR